MPHRQQRRRANLPPPPEEQKRFTVGLDVRTILSGGNFVMLIGILVTAIGSWNTLITGVAKTDIVVTGIKDSFKELKETDIKDLRTKVDTMLASSAKNEARLTVVETDIKRILEMRETPRGR